jgi:hypothetical protein
VIFSWNHAEGSVMCMISAGAAGAMAAALPAYTGFGWRSAAGRFDRHHDSENLGNLCGLGGVTFSRG